MTSTELDAKALTRTAERLYAGFGHQLSPTRPSSRIPEPTGPPFQEQASSFDVDAVRSDFPILSRRVNGRPLVWLDNGATTQKPRAVVEAIDNFYMLHNSNVHRGAHTLAAEATDAYETARHTVQHFLGATRSDEIVFVRGTTEAINLLAHTIGDRWLGPGEEIVLTTLEHHANIVPWQEACRRRRARLRMAPIDDNGDVCLDTYQRLLGTRTRVVALTHVSNVVGTVLPIRQMADLAHAHGAIVIVDGAQAAARLPVHVTDLGADFYALSGHKVFGPTGIGALYGRHELLEQLPPYQTGGGMIETVTFEQSTFRDAPHKFEAGTGHLSGAVGLAAALDYLVSIGRHAVARHEENLMAHAVAQLAANPGVRVLGDPTRRVGAISFVMADEEPEETARRLDHAGVAVRAGHHCAQPALRHFGLTTAVRASLALYNSYDDIDTFIDNLR